MSQVNKKLAEVAAFACIGEELLERGKKAALLAFGEDGVRSMQASFKNQLKSVEREADKPKLERTIVKLRGMMEVYIGDNWDDPTEILEWSGFFLGASQVHWALINNVVEDSSLKTFADQQVRQYNVWLDYTCERIGL